MMQSCCVYFPSPSPELQRGKQLKEIQNFKKEGDETFYQAWERYNDLLYKCLTYDLNNHQKVNIFYKGLDNMTRKLLNSQGPIPNKTPDHALTVIQTMTGHSQKWHDRSTSRRVGNDCSDGITTITNKLDSLGRDMKKLKDNVQLSKAIFTKEGLPLYTPFYYSPKEIEYFFVDSCLSDEKVQEEMKEGEEINHEVAQSLNVKAMGSLKRIKINRPLLKEIRKTDYHAKHMKNLVENKLRSSEDEDIKMNTRCLVILQNHLPPKEQDPGSFTLPCSIGKLTFNALADLGASISVMPLLMFKRLGIRGLKPKNMTIEMADRTQSTLKGIVENLLDDVPSPLARMPPL
ncbi:hypothetical protein Tco_1183550 [Tanacetum coccineum]